MFALFDVRGAALPRALITPENPDKAMKAK